MASLPLSFLGKPTELCIATPSLNSTIKSLLPMISGPWNVYTFSPSNVLSQTYRGQPSKWRMRVGFAELGGMAWEVMQPLPLQPPDEHGDVADHNNEERKDCDMISSFLLNHGEGLQHVAFSCNDIPWKDRLSGFRDRGFSCVMSGIWQGKREQCHFAFFEGDRGEKPLTFETIWFEDGWEWPEAEEVFDGENPPLVEG